MKPKCEHDWRKDVSSIQKYGSYFVLYDCKMCHAGKFEDTGTILTPLGKARFMTSFKLLGEGDFE